MQNRTFPQAVTLSIAAHIAIFGGALAFAQYAGEVFRNSGTVITVSLVSGGGGGGVIKKPDQQTARRMPANAMPQAFPVQESVPAYAEDARAGEAAASAAGSDGGGTTSAGQGAEPGSDAVTGMAGGQGGLSSEQWRQLHSAIEQVKTYPRFARERGIEGTVLVRFKVLPSGTVETVNVVKSSGASILDEASVTTVYRAAPMPFVSGWIEVPLSYVLK